MCRYDTECVDSTECVDFYRVCGILPSVWTTTECVDFDRKCSLRIIDMAVFLTWRVLHCILQQPSELEYLLTWSLSSVIRRRRQPACNMSGQIRLILALPWRNNRRIDEIYEFQNSP